MTTRRARVGRTVLGTLTALSLALPASAQRAAGGAVIWQDRGDVAALDMIGGPGGRDRQPGVDFTFIKESQDATSPKFEVQDEHGVTWKVKLGDEAKSETAATRLLWAAGYRVDEDYYRASIRVQGLPPLVRGQEFVSDGGIVSGARLERERTDDVSTTWSWYSNPFVGGREFNGLRVMMALVNNWDLKDDNNGVFDAAVDGGHYGITDLGATFGRTGSSLNRSKGVLEDYAKATFIKRVTSTDVNFGMHSRPFFLSVFHLPYYRMRTEIEGIVKHVPIADARWIGGRLARLSEKQIRDSFRAGGFSPDEVEAYTRVVRRRIAALTALAPRPRVLSVASIGEPSAVTASTEATADVARCLVSTCRSAPLRERLSAIAIGSPYARAVVGGFEQGAGVGGGIQLTSAQAIPVVEFRAAALTSTRLYRRFDVEAFFPQIRGSRNYAVVWFSHQQRDTRFFDIGPRGPDDVETSFATVRRSVQGSFYRDLADHLQGGLYAQVMATQASRGSDTALPPIDGLFSSTLAQAPAQWLPGLLSTTRIASYGGFLVYDRRDNSAGLTRGINLYGRVASADGLGTGDTAPDYRWNEVEVDARGYVPLRGRTTSLALRSRGQFKTSAEAGVPIPFTDLSWLGGRTYVRGYEAYRFRGNNVLLVSAELQQTLRALTSIRGIDVFAFGDTGQVWGDGRSTTDPAVLDNQAFGSRNWHSGSGGGVQYRHSRSVAVRVEVGRGRERTLLYWSLSRGF